MITCVCDLVGEITNNISLSCKCNGTCMESNNPYEVQSRDEPDGTNLTSEVVTFVDNSTGEVEDIQYSMSSIASASSTLNTDLQSFLSRPTKIHTLTWSTSDLVGIQSTIEPWYEFLNNSTIKNKIQNYAFMRAKLHLKFVINATPFHFGLYRIAYEPSVDESGTGFRKTKIRGPVSDQTARLIPLSQLPGVYMVPADNSGGELIVPYFLHTDWLNLNSAAQVRSMGTLTYYLANALQVASATGSSTVNIETFAWLEDVEFNGSTAKLVLQGKDEYDGPISKVATAVASVSSRLSDVPVIGKFARATEIGAGAIANIAAMFGFTNVPVIDDVHAYVPSVTPHLASAEISTPVQKLTLDPKQELSVDPSMHGLEGGDHMTISKIVAHNSALTIFDWATTQPTGTSLWSTPVNPALANVESVVDSGATQRAVRVNQLPMSYLGNAFAQWRGDICFEFTVICTKFHKGRLKFSWDPLGAPGNTDLDANQVYTTILDVGENNKAILRVPFHQAYAFLRTRPSTTKIWSSGSTITVDLTKDNGAIVVTVLNPLMSPISPQTVGILVSAYAADNFEFANPKQSFATDTGSAPPSFFAVQAKDEIDIVSTEITFGDNGTSHPERYKQNMGQSIRSLRTLLHRYSLYDVSMVDKQTNTRAVLYNKSYTRFPPMFGFDPNGQSTANNTFVTGGTGAFNFTPTHPITYFGMLYAGFSGGLNYCANLSSDLYPSVGDIRVQRYNIGTEASFRRGSTNGGLNSTDSKTTSLRFYNMNVLSYGNAGAAITNTITNGSLNWYTPMMASTNLNYPDPSYSMTGNSYDQTNLECSFMSIYLKQDTANTISNGMSVVTYAAGAPDFNLFWFLCCPTLDYYLSIPSTSA